MDGKTAFIFPAFITSFTFKELDILINNEVDLNQYIQRASNTLNIDLPDFDYDADSYQKDELLSQIIAYTFSCAFSDLLFKKEIQPDYVAGYSMGIYASLYSSKSIQFENGIRIISEAFQLVNELSSTGKYGMGAIIGLSFDDIMELIINNNFDIDIININNERSIVVSGAKSDILLLLDLVQSEGAFSVSELTVHTPYHSKYLKQYSDRFNSFISGVDISDTKIPIISTYDQREIHSASEIKKELVYNLTEKINWYKTMQKMIAKNVSVFYECGAGKDLSKIARFIEGDYEIKSVSKI